MMYLFGIIKLRAFLNLCLLSLLMLSSASYANEDFLAPDQAFQFSAESVSEKQVQLKWNIAPEYYLYHDQFKVTINNTPLKLTLPKGQDKDDPTFGLTKVHYHNVATQITVQPNSSYQVVWQGCAEEGLCYPLQRKSIQTDSHGLLPQQAIATPRGLLAQNNKTTDQNLNQNGTTPTAKHTTTEKREATQQQENASSPDQKIQLNTNTNQSSTANLEATSQTNSLDITDNPVPKSNITITTTDQNSTTSLQWNDDQSFFKLLSKDSLIFNLFIFFGLGILLAFLPCSLPLIPILSGIIIQRTQGYKAVAIALSFVISMALVYSLMGIVVAEIGYSFQRWFQSPIVISLFALLFIAFALNLFGVFQLSMPQAFMQKLNRLQDRQKGGTLVGAMVMGALSALIVGPCMSAPLAGALLFVSQLQSTFLGGLYLFILGLGIGLPLFIASVFGSKFLPKPGVWMDRLKVCFGFMMLIMAVYFIRPMIPSVLYSILLALLCFIFAIYLLYLLRNSQKKIHKVLLALFSALVLLTGLWNIQQSMSAYQVEHSTTEHLTWFKVTNRAQLEQALHNAQQLDRPIVIDVYADWCVACQPLEKEVFPRADVQAALKNVTLIKLDLTQYDESQDLILKEREILGPPTLLFLNAQAEEIRSLRLTGTFSAAQLMQQLSKVEY